VFPPNSTCFFDPENANTHNQRSTTKSNTPPFRVRAPQLAFPLGPGPDVSPGEDVHEATPRSTGHPGACRRRVIGDARKCSNGVCRCFHFYFTFFISSFYFIYYFFAIIIYIYKHSYYLLLVFKNNCFHSIFSSLQTQTQANRGLFGFITRASILSSCTARAPHTLSGLSLSLCCQIFPLEPEVTTL